MTALATALALAGCETPERCDRYGALCDAPRRYPLLQKPAEIAAGDLDGDGVIDLITGGGRDGVITIAWGDSSQRSAWFPGGELGALEVLFAPGRAPTIVAALPETGELVMLESSGARRITERARLQLGGQPRALAAMRVPGDGAEQLLVLDAANPAVTLVRDVTTSAPVEAESWTLVAPGSALTIGELDGDGAPDLAVAHPDAARVSVLFGDGAGGFASARDWPAPVGAEALEILDLTGDTLGDLAIQSRLVPEITVLAGAPQRSFEPAPALPYLDAAAAHGLATLTDEGGESVLVAGSNDVLRLWFGANSRQGTIPLDHTITRVRARDVDGDGVRELIALGDEEATVLRSSSAGPVLLEIWRDENEALALNVATVDLDGDGVLDAVAHDYNDLTVWRGRGDGRFDPLAQTYPLSPEPTRLAVGDLTGDGDADVVIAGWRFDGPGSEPESYLQLARGLGDGALALGEPFAPPIFPGALACADLEGDGHDELLIGGGVNGDPELDGGLALLEFTGEGALASTQLTREQLLLRSLDVRDLDGDGRHDVAALATDLEAMGLFVDVNTIVTLRGDVGPSLHTGVTLGTSDLGLTDLSLLAFFDLGDLDQDGALDLLLCVSTADLHLSANVYYDALNGAPVAGSIAEVPNCYSPRLRDLDGDGRLDAFNHRWLDDYWVARGGAEEFLPVVEIAASNGFADVADDIDGDGAVELIEANLDGLRTLAVHEGLRLETAARFSFPSYLAPRPRLVTGDIDGDGARDVLVAHRTPEPSLYVIGDEVRAYGDLWWLRGDGAGGFTSAEYDDHGERTGAALADLDGDGHSELLITEDKASFPDTLTVQRWSGDDHRFVDIAQLELERTIESLRVVDLDGDGRLDLVGRRDDALIVRHGDGAMGFGPVYATPAQRSNELNESDLHLVDLDGDGALEVLTWTYGQPGAQLARATEDRGWAAPVTLPTQGPIYALDSGDMDGDGRVELALKIFHGGYAWWSRYEFDEDGAPRGPYRLQIAGPSFGGRLHDWDGDGALDLMDFHDAYTYVRHDANARIDETPKVPFRTRQPGARIIELAEFTGDELLDLLLLDVDGRVSVVPGGP